MYAPSSRWDLFGRFPAFLACFESELRKLLTDWKMQVLAFKRKKLQIATLRLSPLR
jgi:hypothetical protein